MKEFLISLGLVAGVVTLFYAAVVRTFIARPWLVDVIAGNDVRGHRWTSKHVRGSR